MRQLQRNRLKSSRNDTAAENDNHQPRKPRIRYTADGTLEADLPARPDYDLEILTVSEAVRR